MRLIDADRMIKEITSGIHGVGLANAVVLLNSAPTVEAKSVRRGTWTPLCPLGRVLDEDDCVCSACGWQETYVGATIYKYCPICGADMQEEGSTT